MNITALKLRGKQASLSTLHVAKPVARAGPPTPAAPNFWESYCVFTAREKRGFLVQSHYL